MYTFRDALQFMIVTCSNSVDAFLTVTSIVLLCRGHWHGEVAVKMIEIENPTEEQLNAFKFQVGTFRKTRHENVVLFMGACMDPPKLAIITR